jgi:hypothetical protein
VKYHNALFFKADVSWTSDTVHILLIILDCPEVTVLLGAHALLSNGAVYSGSGTAMVAMMAKSQKCAGRGLL